MRPTETSPLLTPRDTGALGKSAIDGPIRHDIEALNGDRGQTGQDTGSETSAEPQIPHFSLRATIPLLLIGVFFANADTSLVLATNEIISSEFDDLADAGWLFTSYGLAMCAIQPLYGKLSDIYGRKTVWLVSYIVFALGCVVCGAGATLWQVIAGRVIGGTGGGGMTSLVSIIITDLVPLRDVASWRSYVNIAATTGRSLGGPVGGYLADTVGWRWSFYGQCPPTLLAAALVSWKLPSTNASENHPSRDPKSLARSKLKRIDFVGAALLAGAIVCFMLVLDLGGQKLPWKGPVVLALIALSASHGILFVIVEAYWAREPLFPIRLMLHRDVLTSYLIAGLQIGAQTGVMFTVPLYFQVSANASATRAGAQLFPAVAGNAIGMLLIDLVIKKTGRYKLPTLVGAVVATTGYGLLALRWHGHTSVFESLYIVLGGFGTGVALSTTFIALAAGVEPADIAIAGTGLYQAQNIGVVIGLSVAGSLLQTTLQPQLVRRLRGVRHMESIVDRSVSDIGYVQSLTGQVRDVVVNCYVHSLVYTHIAPLIAAALTFFIALSIREHRI